MRPRSLHRAIVLFTLFFWALPASADEKCVLKEVASLPIKQSGNQIMVPVVIANNPYEFAVQLNLLFSQISKGVADALKLKITQLATRDDVHVVSGSQQRTQQVDVTDMSIGPLHIKSFPMLGADESEMAGHLGVIGLDLLSNYDVELDFKGQKLNLFLKDHCPGEVVYWTDSAAIIPFKRDALGGVTFETKLDGKDIVTAIDTARNLPELGLADASDHFGISPTTPGVIPLGPDSPGYYRYTFHSFSLGGISISDLTVILKPQTHDQQCFVSWRKQDCYGASELSIGLKEISNLRLFYAFSEKTLYATSADAH